MFWNTWILLKREPAVVKALVADKLREYRFESYWLDIICGTITTVLNAPLDPGSEDLKFSCIQNRDRLNELEFYFPLKSISPEKLERLFQANMGHQPVYGGSSSAHAAESSISGRASGNHRATSILSHQGIYERVHGSGLSVARPFLFS